MTPRPRAEQTGSPGAATRSHAQPTATAPLGGRHPSWDTPTAAHRPRDVVEDLVGRGVPVGAGLRAKQAGQFPPAILSGDKGRGARSLTPPAGGGRPWDPAPRPPRPSPIPLQRGLSGEGGPEPPRSLRDAVAVPHGQRRRRLAPASRWTALGPQVPTLLPPPPRGGAVRCCALCPTRCEGGASLGGASPYLG